MSLKMWVLAECTKVNGIKRQEKEMELAFNYGLMAQNMKECGAGTKPTTREE